jgi:hypothetical protein
MSSRVLSRADQLPEPGSIEAGLLEAIYHFFDDKKHAFELLASRVAAWVLDAQGGNYSDPDPRVGVGVS